MAAFAPVLEAFFTDRLITQRRASTRTAQHPPSTPALRVRPVPGAA